MSRRFEAPKSPFLVPFHGRFHWHNAPTAPPEGETRSKKQSRKALEKTIERIRPLHRKLYADNRYALLLVFQAMDAAGKDGTIRAVMSGLNPAGCSVHSFKAPSAEELDHDFLWRISRRLPERGRIGIFNRSHYEEVLVVRVHPEYLEGQRLPHRPEGAKLWSHRLNSIRNFEEHLADNGTLVLKFWLNVSRDEQRRRFLDRIEQKEANWKFNSGDIAERRHWNAYMKAYQEALRATSRPWAPWYAIPADDKPFMRLSVAKILYKTLESLDLSYPQLAQEERERMQAAKEQLNEE